MRKEIYLIKGKEDESYNDFSIRILSISKSLVEEKELEKIKVTFTKTAPPKISIIPFKKQKMAAISLVNNGESLNQKLRNESGFSGVYHVEEALPVAYEKTWNDFEHTPGVCLLTLFKQKRGIDYETFIDRWHNSHTPLSLKIHPLWHYNRNVVKEKLTDNSYGWDGVVEEHMRTKAELINPFKFFGNIFVIIPRMIQVYTDTKSFLDYKTIEPYMVTEVHIKS